MEPIDSTLQKIENYGDIPMMPTVLKFGLIGSGILILLSIFQRFGLPPADGENSGLYMIISIVACFVNFVIYVLIMVFAANAYKNLNGGFMSLGRAFGVTFLTGLIMSIASFIASTLVMFLFGLNVGETQGFGNKFGEMSNDPSMLGLIALTSGIYFILGCLAGAFIAFIISLVVKKEKPVTFNVNQIS